MRFVRTIRLKPLLISLLIPLGLGIVEGMILALSGQFSDYNELFKPPLSPPSWLFFYSMVYSVYADGNIVISCTYSG